MNSKIANIEALENLLICGGINLSRWGISPNKSVYDLWVELGQGETTLSISPLLRIVNVAVIHIRFGRKILIETEQRWLDGKVRTRNLPPSEKMKAGESYLEAAIRGLQEELQVQRKAVLFIENSYQESFKLEDSHSYPGLGAKYIIHTMDAIVTGLPHTEFATQETPHVDDQDPVAWHHWAWKPVEALLA